MASTVGVNKLSIVNEDSSGISIALPDVCLTPAPPAPPIPIPYPNIAQSSDIAKGSKKVTAQGKPICVEDSTFSKSSGDDAGTAGGGVASGLFQGKAEFMNYSFDVQFEGKNVPRSFDLMLHNSKNTPPFPVLQGPVVALGKTASAPKKAEEPTPSASCDWCLIKLPSLGTKLKGGGSGEDVKKLHQHLKDFGFKVELSEFKGGKWQESDELSKGSWGPATARAVRMFAQHPKVGDEEEMIIGTSGAVVTANLGKKLAAWCDKKIQSPQNYWEYQSLNITPGDRDALGSKDDSTQQTVLHDFIAQIELDLGKTGFALHDDGLCGLKKPLVPKGEFLPIPRNADGKRIDTHLADMPHLLAKFQRQTQWPWRMKKDGSATDDAKPADESSCVGDPTGIVDLATAKVLHHWASKDLHMVFKKFELTVLKWPPDSGGAIHNADGGDARLRKDAAEAWLAAAKAVDKLGGTLEGEYASSPRPWANGKQSQASKANSPYSWHFSGLAIDLHQPFGSKADGSVLEDTRYIVELDGEYFRIWCRLKTKPDAPKDVSQDRVDPFLQYRNRNIRTKHQWGATGAAPSAAASPGGTPSATPSAAASPGGGTASPSPGAGPTPAGAASPSGTAASSPSGAAAPGGGLIRKAGDPFDASPLYAATTTPNAQGNSVLRVTAPEGWYIDLTAILEAHKLIRIRRHSNWLTVPKAWEWWHYQYDPPLPPGVTKLHFAEYLQLIGVHEYQLRNVSKEGWPAHEDVDNDPG